MDITLDRQESNEALIKIKLKEADYQPQLKQKVKEYSRKAQLKGFRPGKVPTHLVQKMYGKSILVEEISKILNEAVNKYIQENDLKILGEPLPNRDKNESIDWDHQKEFDFEYRIGLVDDFKYDISKKNKVTEYQIKVEEDLVSEELQNIQKNYGERIQPEISEAGDSLQGIIKWSELEIENETSFSIEHVLKKQQKKFIGLKPGDTVSFDLKKTFEEPGLQARLVGRSEEELKDHKKVEVIFEVDKVTRIKPAELNQELFDQLFGKDHVTSEEELRQKIRDYLSNSFQRESQQVLSRDIRDSIMKNTKIDLPEGFLKQWMQWSNEGKISAADAESQYTQYAEEMKWNLILNRIAEDNELKVENEEVVSKAKDLIRAQLASSGLGDQMEDQLDSFADNYLRGEDGQNYLQVFNQVRQQKIMAFVREQITIKDKEVDMEEFRKAIAK